MLYIYFLTFITKSKLPASILLTKFTTKEWQSSKFATGLGIKKKLNSRIQLIKTIINQLNYPVLPMKFKKHFKKFKF